LAKKVDQSSKQKIQERLKAEKQRKEREKIVEFFLNLYNIQLKGPEHPSKSFRLIDHRQNTVFTYELKIKHSGKWFSRPMGIMPIGEETERKSQCFKVIYDDILVVKIPQNPIKNFEKYVDAIRNERKIARKLQPEIECIVPEVSPVLKKIPSFFQGMCWVPEEVEDKCIERLKHFPMFQDYLKLDGKFVFFMDISRYSFLIQHLDNFFNLDQKIEQEIIKHPDFITKFQKFEERYGVENTPVWLEMNQVFQDYQIKTDSLVTKHGFLEAVPDYKKKQWFLTYLAGKKIIPDDSRISDDFLKELNFTLLKFKSLHVAVFRNYLKTIKSYVETETFLQSKIRISGVVAGILRLLALLNQKKTAVRDLKPDNIFVAEDSTKILTSTAQRQDVILGLIDLETGVGIDETKIKKLEQPLPGGTPSYATPSNFVSNELLEEVFDNVPRILHLQDWHASICMIYLTVTGISLFQSSKNLLYELVNNFQIMQGEKEDFLAIFKNKNCLFWDSAQNEFSKKIYQKENHLKEIEVALPFETCEIFLDELKDLKIRPKDRTQWMEVFKSQSKKVNAYNIIIFMFKVVTQTMLLYNSKNLRK
jgi:serine/threonine protein kinase